MGRPVWKTLMGKKKRKLNMASGFPIIKKIFKELMKEKTITFPIALQ